MRAAFKALTGTARLCLARAFGSEARYWEQRLPFDATEVDMVDNPGEQFYATLYLDFILPALPVGQPSASWMRAARQDGFQFLSHARDTTCWEWMSRLGASTGAAPIARSPA